MPAEPHSAVRPNSPVATAMAVLRCFDADRPVLGVVEIADIVGLHKSTVSRILVTLEREELVEQDPVSKKYRLSLGLLRVAGSLLAHLDVRRVALPVLTEAAAESGESASLLLWDHDAPVVVEQVPSSHTIKHATDLGTRYGTVESSSARVFLREMDERRRAECLSLMGSSTEHLLSASRADHPDYTVNNGLTVPDEVGVSAPVHDHRQQLIAAVLLAAPRYRVDADRLAEMGRVCTQAASRITSRIGGTDPRITE